MEIYFKEEGREKLISGINKLEQAVAATMGPGGRTVIVPDPTKYGEYTVTKDGVTVANSIQLDDPVENIGASFIRKAAQNTVDQAGDGTTTATVLAAAFVNNLSKYDTKEINKAFDEIIPKVLDHLKENSKELKQSEIKDVASISANGDIQIGTTIQQAYNHADIVKVEAGNTTEDVLELKEGMSLPVSYLSDRFVTNERKQECLLDNPHVLLISGKLDTLKHLEPCIRAVSEAGESLLIITEHAHETPLRILESNVLSGKLNACVMKTPGFGGHRQNLIQDLAKFTGALIISDPHQIYSTAAMGRLKSCKITKHSSLLVKSDEIDITETIEILRENLKSTELNIGEKDLLEQRIEYLTGKVSVIKVGGKSDLDANERKDRYEDAVLAVQCALEEGIVEGGGEALKHASCMIREMLDMDINIELGTYILDSLRAPQNKIKENGYTLKQWDYMNVETKSMFELGIMDPLKVTRCALENAVSIAKTILSTDAVVLDRLQWKKN